MSKIKEAIISRVGDLYGTTKSILIQIYPTEEQEIFFAKAFGCVRKVYNLVLDDRKKAYEEVKKRFF